MKHLHIYKRVKHPKRKDLWYCILPDCTHRINQMYLLDKQALCPDCREPFTITSRMLRDQTTLHCDNCKRRGPNSQKVSAEKTLDTLTAEILKGL